jgi:hypothetical protein
MQALPRYRKPSRICSIINRTTWRLASMKLTSLVIDLTNTPMRRQPMQPELMPWAQAQLILSMPAGQSNQALIILVLLVHSAFCPLSDTLYPGRGVPWHRKRYHMNCQTRPMANHRRRHHVVSIISSASTTLQHSTFPRGERRTL